MRRAVLFALLLWLVVPGVAVADKYELDDAGQPGAQHVRAVAAQPGQSVVAGGTFTLTYEGNAHAAAGSQVVFALDKVENAPADFEADDVVVDVPADWGAGAKQVSALYHVGFTAPAEVGERAIVVKWAPQGEHGRELTGGDELVLKLTVAAPSPTPTAIPTPIDTTAPVVAAVLDPPRNADGWNDGPVTVSWRISDPESGVDAGACPPTRLEADTAGTVVVCTATNGAGLTTTTSATVRIDATRPVTTAKVEPAPSGTGWGRGPVTVTLEAADAGAGVASVSYGVDGVRQPYTGPFVVSGEGTHRVVFNAVDKVGNVEAQESLDVKIDATPPRITATADGARGDDGWFVGPVTVSFTCADDGSGIAVCPKPLVVDADGAGRTASATAVDNAGNTATATIAVNVDRTAPSAIGVVLDTNGQPLTPSGSGWYKIPVLVRFTCQDATSGIAACPADVSLAEGARQMASGIARDKAGNTFVAHVDNIDVDLTRPRITAAATTRPNADGWYAGDVTVHFECADDLSGIASCPEDVTLRQDGVGQRAGGQALDLAGNAASAGVGNIRIDKTPPMVTASRAPAANAAGWSNADVVVTFSCADALSGVASCPTPTTVSAEGADQQVSGTAVDKAGNKGTATLGGISIDKTAPVTTVTLDGKAGADGWFVGPVTATLTGADGLSGVAETSYSLDGGASWQRYTTPLQFAADGRFELRYRSVDRAGNAEAAKTAVLKIDQTAPTVSGSRAPAPNAAGWSNVDVTATFTCGDDTSGVAGCPAPVVVSREGANQSATGTAKDAAGNAATATVGAINVDKTAPAVVYLGNVGRYTVDQTVAIVCIASDGTSGIASDTCADANGPAYQFAIGTNTLAASATDRAGNTGKGMAIFTVSVTPDGLCALTKRFVTKAGVAESLCAKLAAAAQAKAHGSSAALNGLIGAYGNEIAAQTDKSVTPANAAILRRLVGSL